MEEIPQDSLRGVPEHPDRRQRRLDMATLDQIPVGADAIGILTMRSEEDYLVGDGGISERVGLPRDGLMTRR